MKQLLSIYLNWRNDVIITLAGLSFLLIVAECDNLTAFIYSKLVGIAFGVLATVLFCYWDYKGQISEFSNLMNEED